MSEGRSPALGGFFIAARHVARDDGITLEELALGGRLHPDLVARFVAYGLIEPIDPAARPPRFEPAAARRLRTICRLRSEMGINLAGIAVVLDLVDRVQALQRELDRLRGAAPPR